MHLTGQVQLRYEAWDLCSVGSCFDSLSKNQTVWLWLVVVFFSRFRQILVCISTRLRRLPSQYFFSVHQSSVIISYEEKFLIPILHLGGKQWQTTPKNLSRMQRTRAIPVAWLSPNHPKGWIPIVIGSKCATSSEGHLEQQRKSAASC